MASGYQGVESVVGMKSTPFDIGSKEIKNKTTNKVYSRKSLTAFGWLLDFIDSL